MNIATVRRRAIDTFYERQSGKCAICGRTLEYRTIQAEALRPSKVSLGRDVHLDHDHKTRKYRGLLCLACNHLVGWFEKFLDHPDLCDKIRKYLDKPGETSVF